MLSKNSFNALLKTLEEPPAHVKFIFATTEVNKIPVTVLSRCQRFDLRRVGVPDLESHFKKICAAENVEIDPSALASIARAAEGSVRDGLSLLDQAIALSGKEAISQEVVSHMLGQAAQEQIYSLVEALFSGQVPTALEQLNVLYTRGYDPILILNDVLQTLHLLTRMKVVPALKDSATLTDLDKTQGLPLAQKLSLEALGRAYQILLHAAGEAKEAARPIEAVEMALIRACYLAGVPAIDTLMAKQGASLQTAEPVAATAAQKTSQEAPQAAPEPTPEPAPIKEAAPAKETEQAAQPTSQSGEVPPWVGEETDDKTAGDSVKK